VGQPADYAELIVFLAVGALYVTGEVVKVTGGSRL
jgi:NAD(P)-dependent dehydrogenase (short-subunit alcohol dehydrogenase family)